LILGDVAQCSLLENGWSFIDARCFYHRPGDGGSMHVWKVCRFLSHYTTQHSIRYFRTRSLEEPRISPTMQLNYMG
jgi:hypothetical protein